jgi:serine protease Do
MRGPPPGLVYAAVLMAAALTTLLLRSHHNAPAIAALPPGAQALADLTAIDFIALKTPVSDRFRTPRGAAVSVSDQGVWITAASVVANCKAPMVMATPMRGLPARRLAAPGSPIQRVAVLTTAAGAQPVPLADRAVDPGKPAFHIGFPRGAPGEITTRKDKAGAFGQAGLDLYAETGRTDGIGDHAGGGLMSLAGAPVLDEAGRIIGLSLREAPRRGVILALPLMAVRDALRMAQVPAAPNAEGRQITVDNYGVAADSMRLAGSVAQVICTDPPPWPLSALR